MNRAERKKAKSMFRNGEKGLVRMLQSNDLQRCFALCHLYASIKLAGPLSERERHLSDWLVSKVEPCRWYHGGFGGLAAGDELLPAGLTGADPRREGDLVSDRLSRVYFTPDRDFADQYRQQVPGGQLYVVNPAGRIEADPADLRMLVLMDRHVLPLFNEGLAEALHAKGFCAPRATIVEVLE